MTTTARQILKQEFGSARNFMTPTVLKIGKVHPAVAFEISSGEFLGRTLYGVTLAGHDGAGQTYRASEEWSKAFDSMSAATAHVAYVRQYLSGSRDPRAAMVTLITSAKVTSR